MGVIPIKSDNNLLYGDSNRNIYSLLTRLRNSLRRLIKIRHDFFPLFSVVEMDAVHKASYSVESYLEKVGAPLKPYMPLIARFLLVITFLEDAFRIM